MKVAELAAYIGTALLATLLQGCGGGREHPNDRTYAYKAWSDPIKAGTCSPHSTPLEIRVAPKTGSAEGIITCSMERGVKAYRFPAGTFEIDEQLLIPENTSITGAKGPNDSLNPTRTPDWKEQTLFLATRGVTNYSMSYCHAQDMVTTRVGFVLSSYVAVRDVSYQGIDTIRPNDNGALCGGGAFETKGCAENDCQTSSVNNGGSDGIGSVHVTIENVRLNDFYHAEDKAKVGAVVEGNYDCKTEDWSKQCCFCKPNDVRSSQVAIWVPQTRNAEGTRDLFVNNVVSSSSQADAINLHGTVHDALVQSTYVQNTGDDSFALWGGELNPANVTFKDCVAVNPGILRPNWYGHCVATYGLRSVVFDNLTCKAPTPQHPIPSPSDGSTRIDTTMFVFYNSFGAGYPTGNSITIKAWTFEDLHGNTYTAKTGTMDRPASGKMVWTKPDDKDAITAPYYIPTGRQRINVHVTRNATVTRVNSIDAEALFV